MYKLLIISDSKSIEHCETARDKKAILEALEGWLHLKTNNGNNGMEFALFIDEMKYNKRGREQNVVLKSHALNNAYTNYICDNNPELQIIFNNINAVVNYFAQKLA